MTQMMLFDSPAISSPAPVLAPAEAPADVQSVEKAPLQSKNVASSATEHEPGLNHMGDLARLVILRYQLVAQRRAERARRAK